jgi:SAM-dependent methyltransferase
MLLPPWRILVGGIVSSLGWNPSGTGGTSSARYCYSVFLRHRIIAARFGLAKSPEVVVELGPGDSLGIGLMALLTGSLHYVGCDAVKHASSERNVAIFDELVSLLRRRESIPRDGECAAICPEIDSYEFPSAILDDELLAMALEPSRLKRIRQDVLSPRRGGSVNYLAPLGTLQLLEVETVDWILSQAVLEHVDSLTELYDQCYRCLKPGGLMTHQIDYRSHDTANEWNGHWRYPNWLWALMRGRRPWFVNRVPHSAHVKLQQGAQFTILSEIVQEGGEGAKRAHLALPFRSLSDSDLATASAMLVSRKESVP